MSDIILDTQILADFLAQFFDTAQRGHAHFTKRDTITKELARRINKIVRWHDEGLVVLGKVVASAFAFVEIARKWSDTSSERFTIEQLASFIEQPPEWFIIEPVDENLILALSDVPADVLMEYGKVRSLEWADAVHIATAFGRGNNSLLAVTDREMRQIDIMQGRLI